MKYNILFIICLALNLGLNAQSKQAIRANNTYNNLNYIEAIEMYKTLNDKKPSLDYKIKIAEAYRKSNQYNEAEAWYSKIVTDELADPIFNFYYGEVLRNNGKYELATTYYEKYYEVNNKTKSYVEASNNPSQFIKDELDLCRVTNLYKLNTKEGEFPCYLSPEEDKLIITSSRSYKNKSSIYGWNNEKYYNLYEVDLRNNNSIEEIKGKINTIYHEGAATINPVTNELVFSRNNYINGKKSKDINNTLNLGIYFAKKEKKKYSNVTPFLFNSKSYSCGHPAFTSTGEIMFFTSNMPGGFGGTDIYMTISGNEGWGSPINLGPSINTDRDEMFPYIIKDSTLYFASNGHPGLGGYDVFKSKMIVANRWGKPENLGSPINSSRDDFALVLNSKEQMGYLGSNRENGIGSDDIFMVKMGNFEEEEEKIVEDTCFNTIKGTIKDDEKNTPIEGVQVIATEELTGIVKTTTTNRNGNYELKLDCNKVYDIQYKKDQYFIKSNSLVSTDGDKDLDESLSKIVVDKPIQIKNIYYDLDKYNIRPDAQVELNKIVKLLQDNENLIIELSSHTDSRGSKEYNQTLSENRAKSAVSYLISRNINAKRLYSKGYGESKLINECQDGVTCSEEKHALNRRTEFRVIGFSESKFGSETISSSNEEDKNEIVFLSQDYQVKNKNAEYYIQIGVFKAPDLSLIEKYTDLGVIKYEDADNGMKRILLGVYKKHSVATSYLEKVKQRGTKDAFIVAFVDGKKVTIEEAITKEK